MRCRRQKYSSLSCLRLIRDGSTGGGGKNIEGIRSQRVHPRNGIVKGSSKKMSYT